MMTSIVRSMERLPYWFLGLAGRLVIALVFWMSGRTKVDGWNIFTVNDKTRFLFVEEYRLPVLPPEIAAVLAQIAEHALPALLILGLGTRFAALGLLIMTAVIQIFVYPGSYLVHGLWAVVLLMLISRGAGALSLDRILLKHRYG